MKLATRRRLRCASRRRPAFRPAAESLESRLVLSGSPIGVSLDSNSWYAGNPIWTDLHNQAVPWSPLGGDASPVPLSADGYPLENAQTSFAVANDPAGNYQFSYTGSGTVAFSGATLVGPVTVSGGVTSGTLQITSTGPNAPFVTMNVTGVDSSNPMDNFHLMLPGYGNGTSPEPMFTPQFLQALKPFSDIRFLNWEHVNNSTVSDWSQRVQPNAFLTDSSGGVPYEDMITLANDSQKDIWINIPALATPQYVQNLAQLVYNELDPNLNVYFEFSNEVWNGGFLAYHQVAAAALNNPTLDQSLGQYQLVAQQTAYSLLADAKIFDQVFGSGAARVRPILGGQASWTQFQQYELAYIQQTYGPPSQYIYATAVAPYFSYTGAQTSGLTVASILANLQSNVQSTFSAMQSDAAVAKQYGVPLVAYEGGPSIVPNSSDLAALYQAQNDPRMEAIYQQYLADWQSVGGGLFDAYQLTGLPSIYGLWGALRNVTQAGSPEYDALVSSVYQPGDANFAGTVNYADFQTLASNYGVGNTYWSQGDFNGAGTVNLSDLNMLRQNLNPAGFTPAQFAQQAVFGQPATVDTSTALEYDGYGVTYAGSLPFSSTIGTVNAGTDSLGKPITLGGVPYAQGLGMTGGSSTVISLNGQYSEFDAMIGVDGDGSNASSVIFQVYGDGSLLYQSPTETSGSSGVPIAVNVAGVQKLMLVVEAAPGSTAANDHGVWADARLVSTSNFGATAPYSLTWQVSQNGNVISTQTADSYVLPAVSGTYTVALTVSDPSGNQGTASTTVTVVGDVPSALLRQRDSITQGKWIGSYGSQGYVLAGGATSLPSYASVSVGGGSSPVWTWADNTTDPRGLSAPNGIGATAETWYGGSLTIDVNLGDGQVHDVGIYAVDWDNKGRSENVQVINAATGSVLDSETILSFTNGEYLQWAVSGNVIIKVTGLSGPNAVISGVFLDPNAAIPTSTSTSPVTFLKADTTTQGAWIGKYGTQGYSIAGVATSLPSYATVA
ncbi:MAG: NPCBM/NEW2 domain-containing protein, partial [Isosphaeraceae bacterium]